MPRSRILGILLLLPLLGACALFRPRPPTYEWVALDGDLRVRDLVVPTEGPEVQAGDDVTLHYVLSLDGGKLVESSRERGQPIRVSLGTGALPAGLERGILGMRLFGRRRIIVPPEQGYGSAGHPPFIPPDARLRFDVEIMGLAPAEGARTEAVDAPPGAPGAPGAQGSTGSMSQPDSAVP